jgi:voltage-gated potassium channel
VGLRRRTHEVLEVAGSGDRLSRYFDIFILSLIALNVVAMVFETVQPVYACCPIAFQAFEIFSVIVFSIEYLLRLWSCTASGRYAHPVRGRLRFAFSFLGLIDLLAIVPFYLPFLGIDLRFFRAVRLLRVFRVAKLGRYSKAIQTFGRVFKEQKEELVASAFILLLLLLIASCVLYYAEREAQPEAFGSIPAAMWWGVATLTTVGYGDVAPITVVGKLIASVIAILGIGVFALPTGILAVGFVEDVRRQKGETVTCPHCGADIDSSSTS